MAVSLGEAIRSVLLAAGRPMSPGQIRDEIKQKYPHLYATPAHLEAIVRGNFQNEDHALLNPIYSAVTRGSDFVVDRSQRPMQVSLATDEVAEEDLTGENYELETGLVYLLATDLFTRTGKHIVKIGHTTQTIEARINQLYTTGTPYQFKVLKTWRVKNYIELEQALHRLMAPFRVNRAREFFTEEAIDFIDAVVDVHNGVQQRRSA